MSAGALLSLAAVWYLVGATPLWEFAARSRHTQPNSDIKLLVPHTKKHKQRSYRRPEQSSEIRNEPFSDLPSDAFVLNEHFVDYIENTDNTQTATRTVDPDKKYRSNTQHYVHDRSTDTQGKTNLFSVYLQDKPIKKDAANLRNKAIPQETICNSSCDPNYHFYFMKKVSHSNPNSKHVFEMFG